MNRRAGFVLLAGALVVALAACAPAAGPPKPKLRLLGASSTAGSSFYIYAVAEAQFLNTAVPELNITIGETGGGPDNVNRMAKGEYHTSHTGTTGIYYQAFQGLGPWEGKPIPDLRLLWTYSAGTRVAFVTEASGVTSLKELQGKKLNPGMRGSSTEKDFEAYMKILGYKPDYYRGGLDDAVSAIKNREIIGYVKAQPTGAADASTLDVKVFIPIRALGFTEEEMAKIKAERPWEAFVTLKKDELWRGSPEILTIGNVSGTLTMKGNIPNEVAYKMIKAMNEKGAEEIALGVAFMKGWKYAERTVEFANIPLHAGVAKYIQEVGFKLKPEQIAPEMK